MASKSIVPDKEKMQVASDMALAKGSSESEAMTTPWVSPKTSKIITSMEGATGMVLFCSLDPKIQDRRKF